MDPFGGYMELLPALKQSADAQVWNRRPMPALDKAALSTALVPGIGDVLGLAADARRFAQEPESRTPLNVALSGLGLLPFVPSLGIVAPVGGRLAEKLTGKLPPAMSKEELRAQMPQQEELLQQHGVYISPVTGRVMREQHLGPEAFNLHESLPRSGEAVPLRQVMEPLSYQRLVLQLIPAWTHVAPELRNVRVAYDPYLGPAGGFDPEDTTIYLRKLQPNVMEHELQHAVQELYGLPQGITTDTRLATSAPKEMLKAVEQVLRSNVVSSAAAKARPKGGLRALAGPRRIAAAAKIPEWIAQAIKEEALRRPNMSFVDALEALRDDLRGELGAVQRTNRNPLPIARRFWGELEAMAAGDRPYAGSFLDNVLGIAGPGKFYTDQNALLEEL